jgi:hypothetical protein
MEPQLLSPPAPDFCCKFYGELHTDDLIRKLLLTQDIARKIEKWLLKRQKKI